MASTSTNKQPLLIDRVLHSVVDTASLSTGSATALDIQGANSSAVLVDCATNDGAIVEAIYSIARAASNTPPKVSLFLSNANDFLRPSEAVFIGQFESPKTLAAKEVYDGLTPVLAPPPGSGTTQFKALYIPSGMTLWVSIFRAGTNRLDSHPIVGAQGGFY